MRRVILPLFFFTMLSAVAQRNLSDVTVDKNGILRWGGSKEEVKGFGINYTVPFAHAYKTALRMGIDIEKAIDDDVYHFARLGFDLYRIHVWDTEISDTLGNLINNENLRLFDYMVKKMKDRGMKFILTPIAYWGNGWPEPDDMTPGFSRKYGKNACLTHPDAIKAQEKYLYQFLNHVNPYTNLPYKSDPDVIAFEISNEPHHAGPPEKVTEFINGMVQSMRATGCRKPIFYNISHSIHLVDAYFNSSIQGGTFQWYPTGLGSRHELGGNFLLNVDRYTIPFAGHPKFKSMAKIVYEFDAADIGRSYIYPAMARSFREAGMQVATHFAYDPTYMASINTEYGTHYMNLAFAPQKALSLMLAGEVFRKIPMYESYGRYPNNTSFEGFKISYENDLAEFISDTQFIYTNTTSSVPKSPENLVQVAGSENSSVVQYQGTGAYFLDKVDDGIWRLEVMPDALWIRDPFERTSPKREVTVINWRDQVMTIQLPNLGENFSVQGVNQGNSYSTKADAKSFIIKPGTYLVTRDGVQSKYTPSSRWKNITIGEFAAPSSTLKDVRVIHKAAEEITAGKDLRLSATIVAPNAPTEVELYVTSGNRPLILKMDRKQGYDYEVTVPKENISTGFLRYYVIVKNKDQQLTFPGGYATYPRDWDFYSGESYQVPVVNEGSPVYLFSAATDNDRMMRQWVRSSSLKPTGEPGKAELVLTLEKLLQNDFEGNKVYDYSMKYFFGDKIDDRRDVLESLDEIVFRGRSLNEKNCVLQVALITRDGSTFGKTLVIEPAKKDYPIDLSTFQKVGAVTLPRPYPTFLPYFFEGESVTFRLAEIESLQISIGPGIPESELLLPHGIAIESVRIQKK